MGLVRAKNLSLKAEVGKAINDFESWPQWAKEIPFENSDRVTESRLVTESRSASTPPGHQPRQTC
jgi:hypothetical protein